MKNISSRVTGAVDGQAIKTTVLMCESAYATMYGEVRDCDVETGGILIGLADPPIIVAAGCGGDDAIREPARFSGDINADGRCLNAARQRFAQKVGRVGAYHKHPYGMSRWSGQDLAQARTWARDFGDGRVVLVGIFAEGCPHRDPRLFLYGISDPHGTLEPLHYEVVADGDVRVASAMHTAPVIPELRNTEFWTDSAFKFYENPIGRERLQREVAELRARGWDVVVQRARHESGVRLKCCRRNLTLEARLPREYPLNPPRLFLDGAGEFIGIEILRQWNSDQSLAALLEVAAIIARCPRCRHQAISPKGR